MKAAVIGLGRMGAEPSQRLANKIPEGWLPISHIEAIKSLSELNLTALCDSDQARVERFTEFYGIENGYCDYRRMIEEIKPQFLSIATRTAIRKEIIFNAVSNGVKFIYAEKPLCNSVKEAEEIMESLAKHGVRMAYGVNRRYHYLYRKAKQMVLDGEIGTLKEIQIENGYGNLLWSHPHSADLLLFFANTTEIEYLQGKCNFQFNYLPSDSFIDDDPFIEHAYIKFKNGIQGVINNASGTDVKLCGTSGNLTIHGDGKFLSIHKGSGYFYDSQIIHEEPSQSATVTALRELIQASDSNKLPITPEEITTGLLILTGIVQSSLNNSLLIRTEDINKQITITGKLGDFFA